METGSLTGSRDEGLVQLVGEQRVGQRPEVVLQDRRDAADVVEAEDEESGGQGSATEVR